MKMKKALALLLCAVLLVAGSVLGTLAYLSSTTEVAENTFTVGNVEIWLDETDVDGSNTTVNGKQLINEGRDLVNTYSETNSHDLKLIPGCERTKDPTVWVKVGSEKSYIRMLVTVSEIGALEGAFGEEYMADGVFLLQKLVDWNEETWAYAGYSNGVYEFRYAPNNGVWEDYGTVAGDYYRLPALFTTITVPEDIDNEHLAKLQNVEITVVAHAIQAEGFNDDAAKAWKAFGDK